MEVYCVLEESLSLGVVLALDREPRQCIKLHQLKELGPKDAALDGLAILQTASAT